MGNIAYAYVVLRSNLNSKNRISYLTVFLTTLWVFYLLFDLHKPFSVKEISTAFQKTEFNYDMIKKKKKKQSCFYIAHETELLEMMEMK